MPVPAQPWTVTTVLLLRHGETTWNREGRMQGWAPTPLTDRGHEQARRAGAAIADAYAVDRVVASDLRRTRETTAAALSAGLAPTDPEPAFNRRWRERSFGDLQGLTVEEVFGGHPEYSLLHSGVAGARATPPGGESLLDARERVIAGWDALVDDAAPDETVLVVTHGGPLFLLLAHVRGQDFETAMDEGWPENTALAELRIDRTDDGVAVTVVRGGEPLHEPVPEHDDTHPAEREPTDEGGEVQPPDPADTDAAEEAPSATTAAVAERVSTHDDAPMPGADRDDGGDGATSETESE
jgi:probable phosphoglycerate mutase